MPSGGGVWTLTAVKGDLTGQLKGVRVMIGEMTTVADITIKAGGVKTGEAANLSNDEIEKRNKKQAELEQLFTDANAAIEAGNFDEAITKLTQMTTEVPKCAPCFAKLGDIYVKKNDLDERRAEARSSRRSRSIRRRPARTTRSRRSTTRRRSSTKPPR